MGRFRVHVKTEDTTVRVTASGELDHATAHELRPQLATSSVNRRSTLLDLTNVPLIDSAGLRALLLAHEDYEDGFLWSGSAVQRATGGAVRANRRHVRQFIRGSPGRPAGKSATRMMSQPVELLGLGVFLSDPRSWQGPPA
jgi:hypothetical protein